MGLLSSIFKRQAAPPRAAAGGVSDSVDEVQRARTRARQRLIGAAVLLGIGVVGFPLVFETQPRPIPVNIPIELPRKEGAPALTMPAATPASVAAPAAASKPVATAPAAAASNAIITESREDAGRDVAASTPSPARAASKPAAKPAEPKVAEAKPAAKPIDAKPEAKADPKPAAKPTDAARARALLEGQGETAADAGRFVVQVGAFADVAAARETRVKVEKLGLKTYTQVAETASGKRIRVRAGPYASRDEAEKALAKARAAGLTAVVLTL